MPTITASGTGKTTSLLGQSCHISRLEAKNRVVENLKAAASEQCPDGYTITGGPTYTTVVDCITRWDGWWPSTVTTYSATATITCDQSRKYPEFPRESNQSDQQSMYELVEAWKAQYVDIMESYEFFSQLTSVEKMIAYLKEVGDEATLSALEEAIEIQKVLTVELPKRDFLLEQGPFGEFLTAMVSKGGLNEIDSFLASLKKSIERDK